MPPRNKSRCAVCEAKCPKLPTEDGPEVIQRNWYLYTIATKILKLKKHIVCQNFINYGIPQNWPEVKLCAECGRKLVTVMTLLNRALSDSDEDEGNDDIFRFLSNFDISVAVKVFSAEGESAAFDTLAATTDPFHKHAAQSLRNLVSRFQAWDQANQENEDDEYDEYTDGSEDECDVETEEIAGPAEDKKNKEVEKNSKRKIKSEITCEIDDVKSADVGSNLDAETITGSNK